MSDEHRRVVGAGLTDASLLVSSPGLTRRGRMIVLAAAFLGWMFAGWEMSLLPLIARSATFSMLRSDVEQQVRSATDGGADRAATGGHRDAALVASRVTEILEVEASRWFARYVAAFLGGAALGGWIFGWYGDRAGRVRGMSISIAWYAVWTGLSVFVTTPTQMCLVRFVACMGVGGMWPAGVALASEAWPRVSRPFLAGLIGASANVGIAMLSLVVSRIGALWPDWTLTEQAWRWTLPLSAAPVLLAIAVWLFVPESPLWLATRAGADGRRSPLNVVLTPPLLRMTLIGIALGTIPLLGAWGCQKWLIPWADKVGAGRGESGLKEQTNTIWAIGAVIGSLSGGMLASLLGRRTTYFLISLGSLGLAQLIFGTLTPSSGWEFQGPVFLLGLVATVFFGWLPLYLPELFPTAVRSTGTGVAFNSGRIISAAATLASAAVATSFHGDHPRIGQLMSWVYLAGMLIVFLMPSTTDLPTAESSQSSS